MLRSFCSTMATALHKVALRQTSTPFAAALSAGPSHSSSLRASVSPVLQPWWRQLAVALPQTAAPASVARWSQRSFSTRASDGEAEAAVVEAEPAVVDVEASEAVVEETVGVERVKTKALTKQVKHIMNILNAEAAQTLKAERNLPQLRPGDVLAMKVEVPENKRRVSLIRGIVIAIHNAGINSTFRIRRIMAGVGVEMVFPLYSPNIKEIKVVDHRRARRAKLYYLRDKIARLSTVN